MTAISECPYANLQAPISIVDPERRCPFHSHKVPDRYSIDHTVPLVVKNGSHQVSNGTAQLLQDIGGGDRIREFCTRFYARAFLDVHIKDFFFMDDGATHHAKRLADWIIQKMGGEGEPWTASGRLGQRQPSHHSAWFSAKRDPALLGRRFQLDDCRVWMRLHFWAARECGLNEHGPFWEWYVEFIEHFIAVYERTAPRYVASDAAWSESAENLARYEEQGFFMPDVVGRT